MTKERLGEEEDERFAEVAVDLATKEVELQKISKSQQLNLGEAPAISTHVVGRSPTETISTGRRATDIETYVG